MILSATSYIKVFLILICAIISLLVVLSGEMGAGKSNILQRYVKLSNLHLLNLTIHSYHKGIFTRISPTIGVEFLTKKIVLENGTVIKA